jgi:hypothetical protein
VIGQKFKIKRINLGKSWETWNKKERENKNKRQKKKKKERKNTEKKPQRLAILKI